ncbi:MAG: LysR family transcriptional regulator [Pseudomonadota bacterium]
MSVAPKEKLSLSLLMAKRIPSLNWLRVFEAAARTSSFARASERLGMSPPAVSQQIRALEEHLGRQLFERKAAGVSLTEAGRGLLVVASDAIGRMEQAAEVLGTAGSPPLVIGVSQTLYVGWLAPRLSRFFDTNPDVSLDFRSLLGAEIPPRDAVFSISFGQPPPGTESIALFGERLVPVALPHIASEIRTPEDLSEHILIEVADHRKNWTQLLDVDFLPSDIRKIQVDTTLAALCLAKAVSGVALARPPASDDLVKTLGLVPCAEINPVRGVESYHLISYYGLVLSRDALRFRNWIVKQVESTSF